jgi:hypothetical protein
MNRFFCPSTTEGAALVEGMTSFQDFQFEIDLLIFKVYLLLK